MTLHLLRFAFGHASIDSLRQFQVGEALRFAAMGRPGIVPHYIRNRRRRSAEFTSDSSLYWIINGAYACRQQIFGFEDDIDEDGRGFTTMLLTPTIVEVDPWPRRNFGGWRYLDDTQVPPDRFVEAARRASGSEEMPTDLLRELERLGLM